MHKPRRGLREDGWGERQDRKYKPPPGLGTLVLGLGNTLETALETWTVVLNTVTNLLCDPGQVTSFRLSLESEGV